MLFTVCTPTYNRAQLLFPLYRSLCTQSLKDFEWIIIDDGSTDQTKSVVESFIEEGILDIKYKYQENGGKHRAINSAILDASGVLFFIADSDDYLLDDSLKIVASYYEQIKENSNFAGVCGLMSYPNGQIIGSGFNKECIVSTALEIRVKYHVSGDLKEVFLTEILKKNPFPEFKNEKFCPEALVWNRIACNYKLLYFAKVIYVADYLDGGLTSKIIRIRKQSPNASLLYYSELLGYDIPFIEKVKASINYWRFSFSSNEPFLKKKSRVNSFSLFLLPIGFLFYLKDRKK